MDLQKWYVMGKKKVVDTQESKVPFFFLFPSLSFFKEWQFSPP